jgi:GntR family transcriptional repressor for pyruvate dehydrogenase complex
MKRASAATPETQLTLRVVDHIRGLIEDGKLKPGDKIPAERLFARNLKISRASLRTGIGYLAAMGVLKVRHGVGAFVSDGPAELGKMSLDLLRTLHAFEAWQMFEARLVLERDLAELAAKRGLEQHFGALAEELTEMYATIESPSEYLIHDVRFHQIIAQAAGNPILASLMDTITAALYEQRRDDVEFSRNLKESTEQHRDLYKAIRSRDGVAARQVMERHLTSAEAAQQTEKPGSSSRKDRRSPSRPTAKGAR